MAPTWVSACSWVSETYRQNRRPNRSPMLVAANRAVVDFAEPRAQTSTRGGGVTVGLIDMTHDHKLRWRSAMGAATTAGKLSLSHCS